MTTSTTPRVVLAGTGSGCGKTTVTCGVLGALKKRQLSVSAFKCGPDYIDPMFHTRIMGIPSRNLDSFLCAEETVKFLFSRGAAGQDIGVIEGVMGFYDGLSGTGAAASTWDIARILHAPLVLIFACEGKSLSLAAEIQGYKQFMPNTIAGVILNGVSSHSYPMYKEIVEQHTGVQVFGHLPKIPEAQLKSRHLGLVTAGEIADLEHKLALLTQAAERYIDLDSLLALANTAPTIQTPTIPIPKLADNLPVAWATDNAFNFYYRDNLEVLEEMGVKLYPFSPLKDPILPPNCGGLLLGGGYPELYAQQLSQNTTMLSSIRQAIADGMPTWAECGGFMLLGDTLTTGDGSSWDMAGALNLHTQMTNCLSGFGYCTLTAQKSGVFCRPGQTIHAHCFHYSTADHMGDSFLAQKQSGKSWETGYLTPSLYAGYPHLHLWSNLEFAQGFVEACRVYYVKKEVNCP